MRKFILIFAVVFAIGGLIGMTAAWLARRSGVMESLVVEQTTKALTPAGIDTALVRKALGYSGKRTYLILFLNNTELRPGGGFIGAYGIVNVENGKPTIEKIDGTENLDNAFATTTIEPPAPLAKYLKIKQWQFRDSNWSPDFPTDSQMALDLYEREHGLAAGSIDGVVAFTPTILEQILKITGPITVGSATYTSDNATSQLEYAVEYGYTEKGYSFHDRKTTLALLAQSVFDKVKFDVFVHWSDYYALVGRMIAQKQIMVYSVHSDEQKTALQLGWGADMHTVAGDYLLWADANLGALKTDAAIARDLTYSLEPTTTGYIANATMRYRHSGSFDWRTTRYLDYVRVFVPLGSTLVAVSTGNDTDASKKVEMVLQGTENGYAWFGGFIHLEPGQEGHLTFTYQVAPQVVSHIAAGTYHLTVQKQSGTNGVRLTLSLNFGKNLSSANPSESTAHFGDKRYDVATTLDVDREFTVNF